MSRRNNITLSPSVESYLKRLANRLGVSDFSVEVASGAEKGEHFWGAILSVRIASDAATLNFIVKTAPRNDYLRSVLSIRAEYEREIYVYAKVLPEFDKLQRERGATSPFRAFARYYGASMDDRDEAVVMENVKERGFAVRKRAEPVDYEHALLVVKTYAKFHALSFAVRDQNPDLFRELSENVQPKYNSQGKNKRMQFELVKVIDALDPDTHKEARDKLKHFQETMEGKMEASLRPEAAGRYAVVTHGDSWINNILFKYENIADRSLPTEVCLIDWQATKLGSPVLDVAYFIFSCTDRDLRALHYHDLICEYHDALCAFLRELGSDPDALFPRAVLQDHLNKFSVYGLLMSLLILYHLNSDDDEIPDLQDIRNEGDSAKKLNYVTKNIEKYRSRVRGVVLDFIAYGYDL